ncbi:hypothetical protein NST28_11685 [Paenibacillus sp. FSL R10-2791]
MNAIREYHLNSSTAIIFFGIAGFIYVLVDYYFERQAIKAEQNPC